MTHSRTEFHLRWLQNTLPAYRFSYSDEIALHNAIATVLSEHNIKFEREVRAGAADRFDFLIEGGIVIEVKVAGTMANAIRQVHRYCERAEVSAVALVANTGWATTMPASRHCNGKTIVLIPIKRMSF